MNQASMQSLLVRFCNGHSVSDLAAFACIRRETVEDVLRQALRDLIQRPDHEPPAVVLTDVH